MVAIKTKNTKKNSNKGMVGPMVDFAREEMAKRPLMTIEQFEETLYTQFQDKWNAEEGETLERSSRLRWENLTDWVKAHLTKERATIYLKIGNVDYIAYIPSLEVIQGAGSLVNRNAATSLMQMIAAKCR